MSKNKTREVRKDIKAIDKAAVAAQRMKNVAIKAKDTAKNLMDDGQISPEEYAEDQMKYAAEDAAGQAGHTAAKGTKQTVKRTKDAYRKHREKMRLEQSPEPTGELHPAPSASPSGSTSSSTVNPPRNVRTRQSSRETLTRVRSRQNRTIKTADRPGKTIRQSARASGKQTVKTTDKSVKGARKGIKTADQTSRAAIKTANVSEKAIRKGAESAAKASAKTAQFVRNAAASAARSAKAAAKATASSIKAIIAATKSLVAAIASGGVFVSMIILVICMIGMLVGSCFGLFFSDSEEIDESTLRGAVRSIETAYQEELCNYQQNYTYDELEMSGTHAAWKEVLSLYSVKMTTDGEDPQEVATMTPEKRAVLQSIFWDMNQIDCRFDVITRTTIIETDDGYGGIIEEEMEETVGVLYITVTHKDPMELAEQYGFNDDQKAQLTAMLEQDVTMWNSVLYGISGGVGDIVEVALSQVGDVGGETYWSWYGFNSHVEWCACFVSWCADQCGYVYDGVCPSFASCNAGISWFRERNQWADSSSNFTPEPGMLIFFDWNHDGQDGSSDHVGIVERVENNRVYTVEGNYNNRVAQTSYPLDHYEIMGYGILNP